jgi:hypothetical protein
MRPALQECRRAAKSMLLNYLFSPAKGLVRALGEQSHQNHEVGKREQPLIRPNTSGFGRAGDETEVTGLGEIVDVLDTDPRQAGNLGICENLLTRLDCDHGLAPRTWAQFACSHFLDAVSILFVPTN